MHSQTLGPLRRQRGHEKNGEFFRMLSSLAATNMMDNPKSTLLMTVDSRKFVASAVPQDACRSGVLMPGKHTPKLQRHTTIVHSTQDYIEACFHLAETRFSVFFLVAGRYSTNAFFSSATEEQPRTSPPLPATPSKWQRSCHSGRCVRSSHPLTDPHGFHVFFFIPTYAVPAYFNPRVSSRTLTLIAATMVLF